MTIMFLKFWSGMAILAKILTTLSTTTTLTKSASTTRKDMVLRDSGGSMTEKASVISTVTADPQCDGCEIIPQGQTRLPAGRTSVFIAYTLISHAFVDNYCQNTAYETTLATPFTATRALSDSESNFSSSATSSFLDFLGFTRCAGLDANAAGTIFAQVSNLTAGPTSRVVLVTSTVLAGFSSAVRTTNSASAATERSNTIDPVVQTTSPRRSGLNIRTKISLGVGLPIVTILITALAIVAIIRYRNRKRRIQPTSPKLTTPEEDQPYFQQKGELDAEESTKYELDAEQKEHELEGDNEIRELPTNAGSCQRIVLERHELRGEEHCKELTAEDHSRELTSNITHD